MHRFARFVALGYLAIVIVVAGLQVLGATRFSAPITIIPAPVRPPITIDISYSSEQDTWIKAAKDQFDKTNPSLRGRPIQITLRSGGSQSIIDGIAQGRLTPTAIIPASSAQIDELNRTNRATAASDSANRPLPIALSPLVLVGWRDRASALFPPGSDVWQQLHETQAKWGHASPLTSNSGSDTLALLAYAYHHKARDLTTADVGDPGFQKWMGEIESNFLDRPIPQSTDALF
jgi:hypothetical protein